MNHNPILYILVRDDLPSLNPGKAIAQACHAANKFMHKMHISSTKRQNLKGLKQRLYEDWLFAQGFGTTVVLSSPLNEIINISVIGDGSNTLSSGVVIDPSYPYLVDTEIVKLIDPKTITADSIKKGNQTIMHREEVTCVYLFGDKEDCKPYVGHLKLY